MKYILTLKDDDGEVLYQDDTQLGEVAEVILSRMREVAELKITAKQIRATIHHWCDDCGNDFTPRKSQDLCDYCYDAMQADHQDIEITAARNEAQG